MFTDNIDLIDYASSEMFFVIEPNNETNSCKTNSFNVIFFIRSKNADLSEKFDYIKIAFNEPVSNSRYKYIQIWDILEVKSQQYYKKNNAFYAKTSGQIWSNAIQNYLHNNNESEKWIQIAVNTCMHENNNVLEITITIK